MKAPLIYICFLMSLATYGQSDKLWRTDDYRSFGEYDEVITYHDKKKRFATVKIYDKQQVLRAETHFRDEMRHGQERLFYADGQLYWKGDYRDNYLNGVVMAYYPDGNLKRKERFSNGIMKEGYCYDTLGQLTPYFPFRTEPSFIGGKYALQKFIRSQWSSAYKESVFNHSFLMVTLAIGEDSIATLSSFKIEEPAQQQAIFKVIKAMPKWNPATFDGAPTLAAYKLSLVVKGNDIYLSELFNQPSQPTSTNRPRRYQTNIQY